MSSRLFQACLFALAVSAPAVAGAAAAASGTASVVAVQPTRVADLVMLDAGFEAGLRQGMLCRIARGSAEIGEVLLVGLRPGLSAALIVSLVPGQAIRPGDSARIKLLKS